jgi:glycosyltransferase involved in cell wall biosynthesis
MPIDTAEAAPKRLVIAGPSALLIARLRGGLIRDCVGRGVRVLAMAPALRAEDAPALISMGAEVEAFVLRDEGFSLWPERKAIGLLAAQFKKSRPDAVVAFGAIAPFVVIAAKRAGIKRIALLVSELPERARSLKSKKLRRAIKASDAVIVHNLEDERLISEAKLVGSGRILRVAGAGADIAGMEGLVMPDLAADLEVSAETPLVFLACSRLDRIKGVVDFLEAAAVIKAEGHAARFVLAGPEGSGTGAVQMDIISRYSASVEYAGDARDLAAAINDAHVFVCPSHLEGMPHALLQAMAAGRPLIATDIAGARETIDEMVNGTLVPPRNPADLADAFRRLLQHRALLPAMARASRAKAARGFAMADVNARIMGALKLP